MVGVVFYSSPDKYIVTSVDEKFWTLIVPAMCTQALIEFIVSQMLVLMVCGSYH